MKDPEAAQVVRIADISQGSTEVNRLGVPQDLSIAGSSHSIGHPATLQAIGVSVTNGNFNFAGRDVVVHNHYHTYLPIAPDLASALRMVRNFRKIHLDVLAKATQGTGVWLLKHEKFLIWLSPNGDLKVIWGTGIRELALRIPACTF